MNPLSRATHVTVVVDATANLLPEIGLHEMLFIPALSEAEGVKETGANRASGAATASTRIGQVILGLIVS